MVEFSIICFQLNIVCLGMKEYEEVIGRIQSSIGTNFTANFRCQDCISREGLPTEENIQAKKKVRVKKRYHCQIILDFGILFLKLIYSNLFQKMNFLLRISDLVGRYLVINYIFTK